MVRPLPLLFALSLLVAGCGDPPPPPEEPTTAEVTPEPTPEVTPEPTPEPTPPPPVPAPRPLTAEDTLPTGTAAVGRVDDWLLTTGDGRVRFVVGHIEHRVGFGESGGNLLDVVVDGAPDQLDGLGSWLNREFPRQGRYHEQSVEENALVVRGLDSADDQIDIETRWEVLQEAPAGALAALQLVTTATNQGAAPLADYDLGDIVGWGGLRHFAPGPGFELKGESDPVPWIGAEGPDHAVLLFGEGEATGPHGSSWSDPVWDAPTIAPGASASVTRTLLVGRTLGELAAAVTANGRPVAVQARDPEGAPIAGAMVSINDPDGKALLVGRTDDAGDLALSLPPRAFEATVTAPDRQSGAATAIPAQGPAEITVKASQRGALDAVIRDSATNEAMPARLQFTGRNGTPDPNLGSRAAAIGRNRANIMGSKEIGLPPGDYSVVATRGPAWSLASADITVPTGGSASLDLTLTQVVPTDGWLQCDLHQHSAHSADSKVPPIDGLIASAAEGLDCIATTEHDVVADWTADLAQAKVANDMLWLAGLEVTSKKQGHFNVYPWAPELGIVEHRTRGPFEISAQIRERAPGAVLQVNHPRMGKIGVFNVIEIDEMRADLDYDVLEILNGKSTADADQILKDVVGLLNAGVARTLVGTSDSHRLVGQEHGVGRSWVYIGDVAGAPTSDLARAAAVDALRRSRRVTASTGPLLDARYHEEHIEITMLAPEWMPVDGIELFSGSYGGGDGAPVESLQPIATFPAYGDVKDGLRTVTIRQRVVDPAAGAPKAKRWYLARARGEKNMEPWIDAPAWALTSPVIWQPY